MEAARQAQRNAYAPYSGFKVGAAVRTKSGQVFSGANVENVSFGLALCAERVCIGAAVAAGEQKFARLVIVTDSATPTLPCGACRQVIAEFSPDIEITCVTSAGAKQKSTIGDLLPGANAGLDVPRRT